MNEDIRKNEISEKQLENVSGGTTDAESKVGSTLIIQEDG